MAENDIDKCGPEKEEEIVHDMRKAVVMWILIDKMKKTFMEQYINK